MAGCGSGVVYHP